METKKIVATNALHFQEQVLKIASPFIKGRITKMKAKQVEEVEFLKDGEPREFETFVNSHFSVKGSGRAKTLGHIDSSSLIYLSRSGNSKTNPMEIQVFEFGRVPKKLFKEVMSKLRPGEQRDRAGKATIQAKKDRIVRLKEIHQETWGAKMELAWAFWANHIHSLPALQQEEATQENPPMDLLNYFKYLPLEKTNPDQVQKLVKENLIALNLIASSFFFLSKFQ